LTDAGQTVSQDGMLLKTRDHQIRVEQEVEGEAEKDGSHLVGLGVRITLDGKYLSALRSGGVGVDKTREAALRTAAKEWSQQFGLVFVRSLYPRASDPAPTKAGHYQIIAGPIALRGPARIAAFDASSKQLSSVINSFVARSFGSVKPGEWHGMNVTAAHDSRQGLASMCQVDGKESPELNEAIKRVAWPTGSSTYMFKQFFLAKPSP
jgi:hypothetical protein